MVEALRRDVMKLTDKIASDAPALKEADGIAKLEAAITKTASDAHAPAAIAEKAETAGINKGKLNTISTVLLGILAGVFIGLGAMLCTLVTTNTGLGFGITKLIGGLVFCLGLILVVVAGAELFTGNTLIVMAWISGRTSFGKLLRNWGLVYFANLAGALSLVALMFVTRQWAFNSYGVGANALAIANAKVSLGFGEALARGILCNALVCLAIWLCFGARTVTDKIIAIVFPITAFVAAGFEHSIANMYFIPMGIMLVNDPNILKAAGLTAEAVSKVSWGGFVGNLVPVTIGNIIGGSLLIGVVYWLAYLRKERASEMVVNRPWLTAIIPSMRDNSKKEKHMEPLAGSIRSQIEELIRASENKPLLDRSGKAILAVLSRAKDDGRFLAKLAENPGEALRGFDLTSEERAALLSGDIKWVESKLGALDGTLRSWLTSRLAQEKW